MIQQYKQCDKNSKCVINFIYESIVVKEGTVVLFNFIYICMLSRLDRINEQPHEHGMLIATYFRVQVQGF